MLPRALAVWPVLAAEILIFGTAVFARFISPRGDSRNAVARALTLLWRWLVVLMALMAPVALLVFSSDMANMAIEQVPPFVPEVIRQTHFGHVWSIEYALVLVLLVVAWVPLRIPTRTWALFVLAGALLLLRAFSDHAIDQGVLAVVIYLIHEASAGLWIGAILGLWFAMVRARMDRDWEIRAAPRVSLVAEASVTILILSGIYTAYYMLNRNPGALIHSTYGRVLIVKVGAATVVWLIGGYNRLVLVPTVNQAASGRSLVRNVGIESVLLIGVLFLAALLANTAPAH
ncbi:MAG: copper resistance D family protein [Candidatus Binataceae bacterium]